jgi:putative hemolysin
VNLRDLETQMNWRLPRDGGVETLAGFLLTRLGKIPTGGEIVVFQGRKFTVLEMNGHRISQVRVDPESLDAGSGPHPNAIAAEQVGPPAPRREREG